MSSTCWIANHLYDSVTPIKAKLNAVQDEPTPKNASNMQLLPRVIEVLLRVEKCYITLNIRNTTHVALRMALHNSQSIAFQKF